jgi:hypothetical protein
VNPFKSIPDLYALSTLRSYIRAEVSSPMNKRQSTRALAGDAVKVEW